MALLLVGGIGSLPWLISLLLDWLSLGLQGRLLPLLAVERARRQRDSAAVALSGVVAALALAVALSVMVASFRDSVTAWLDRLLPADIYVRSATTLRESDTLFFSPALVQAAAQLPGVERLRAQRQLPLLLEPTRPAVALLISPLEDPGASLPLLGDALQVPPGQIGIYVSEAVLDLYGARLGRHLHPWPPPLSPRTGPLVPAPMRFLLPGYGATMRASLAALQCAQATTSDSALTGGSTTWPCGCAMTPTRARCSRACASWSNARPRGWRAAGICQRAPDPHCQPGRV